MFKLFKMTLASLVQSVAPIKIVSLSHANLALIKGILTGCDGYYTLGLNLSYLVSLL